VAFSIELCSTFTAMSSRTLTALVYCTQSTEEILSFTWRLLAPTVGVVGIRVGQYSDLKLLPGPCGSLHTRGIQFRRNFLKYVSIFNSLCILFLPAIFFKNLKNEAVFSSRLTNSCVPVHRRQFPSSHNNIAVSLCTSLHLLACNSMLATENVYINTDLSAS